MNRSRFTSNLRHVIGVIDSGIGGLSVLREIHALLPSQSITYIGDTAWCPYGNKSFRAICERTFSLTDELINRGASMIVVACNSATIAAIGSLRSQYPLPFIGMEPGVKPAAAMTRTGTIGVLATEASLSGEKFHRLVAEHAREIRVITQPCPKFVTLVESGILHGPEVDEAISEYTDDMLAAEADVLILGCSHYPFLRPALERALPSKVNFIDTGDAIARRVQEHSLSSDAEPTLKILTTGDPSSFSNLVSKLAPQLVAPTEFLNLP